MIKPGYHIRWAHSWEGPKVGELYARCPTYEKMEQPLHVDWRKPISGFRLLFVHGSGLTAAAHLLCYPPVAYAENFVIDPALNERARKEVLLTAVDDAIATTKKEGCQAIMMNLDPDDEVWINRWKKHGAQVLPARPTVILEV